MNTNITSENYQKLFELIFELYQLEENKSKLLFHGWHHIKFVHDKAIELATELNANLKITASAALVHDLNYVFSDNLAPEAAEVQIKEYLNKAGFNEVDSNTITEIIKDTHLEYRDDKELPNEAKALADADTLFKALPTTPILFSSKFIAETKYDIAKLAHKIINEQEVLITNGKLFYTKTAKEKYLKWADTNLQMWKHVLDALEDKSVNEMLQTAEDLGVL